LFGDGPVGNEVWIRQMTVDAALIKLDEYLDRAFAAQIGLVRIVHGKGNGTLRCAVRDYLRRHPLVRAFRPGGSGEGGEGVTIAQLKLR